MQTTKSVVISCAGVGSRLGLSKTKALIAIEGKTLIWWQLLLFKNVEDLRIVVGFQANDVIDEVLNYRRDVTFIYNHNYFETNTGASFYLGARHANDLVMEYDGDLLVHPDDINICLQSQDEFVAYSDIKSTDAVYVKTDKNGNVLSFSRQAGDFEWTGPACMKRDKIKYTSGHVYNQLEEYLPLKGIHIRARDIDTYQDYLGAKDFVKTIYRHLNI